jgi:hypothetical protein
MPYVDPNTIHNPATGTIAPAAWGDVLRDDLEFLIDPPACDVFNSSAVSVNNATETILNADSERFDNDAMHSTASNTSRITIQTAGRYYVRAAVGFAGDADGNRRITFLINGTTASIRLDQGPGTSGSIILGAFGDFILSAADFIEVRVLHAAGAALNVTLHSFAATFITR